jgi:Fe-S-cluster containining protein
MAGNRKEILEELLDEAGEALYPPPAPPGGIPPQFLPSWIRLPIKLFVFPFVLLDYAMHKLARKIIRPPFKKEGKCLKRGNCCYYVLIRHSKNLFGKLFYLWQTEINGFYLRYKEPYEYEGKKMVVMGCRYLKKDGTCNQYWLRPMVCREWPVIEHFGYPKILKGCGYRSNPPYPQTFENPLEH